MAAFVASLTRPIEVIEAAYRLDGSPDAWLAGVVDAAQPDLDAGMGVYGFIGVFRDGMLYRDGPLIARDVDEPLLAILTAVNAGPPPEIVQAHLRAHAVDFGSLLATFGGPRTLIARVVRSAAPMIRDSLTGFAQDGDNAMVQLLATAPGAVRIDPRVASSWRRLLYHLGTALRLRRRLSVTEHAPAALLAANGALAHATGDARDRDARAALTSAVRRIERARGRRTRHDPAAALELWRGLVLGRWSLVDHLESDGRRYLAAHENAPGFDDPRGLSATELACLRYYLRGASTAEISFVLGHAPETVGKALSRITRRLGFPNRASLRRLGEAGVVERLTVSTGGEKLDVLVVPAVTVHAGWRGRLGDSELAVAQLAAEGLADREIASRRGSSVRTVSNQLRRTYAKVGATGRADLVSRLAKPPR